MPHDTALRAGVETTIDCQVICQETVFHCLSTGGEHAAPDHLRLLLDCAEICQTTANFMARGSADHRALCQICADICNRCAASCERLAGDDEQMLRCAEACRRCAAACG